MCEGANLSLWEAAGIFMSENLMFGLGTDSAQKEWGVCQPTRLLQRMASRCCLWAVRSIVFEKYTWKAFMFVSSLDMKCPEI